LKENNAAEAAEPQTMLVQVEQHLPG